MKKYESPEILLAKYEIDESIAAVPLSGTYDADSNSNTDKFPFDEFFGIN